MTNQNEIQNEISQNLPSISTYIKNSYPNENSDQVNQSQNQVNQGYNLWKPWYGGQRFDSSSVNIKKCLRRMQMKGWMLYLQ